MTERSRPLFLARRSYRRRRLVDAARLVPLLGGLVMLVPLLWTEPGSGSLAVRGLFLFSAWGLLVLASALLSHRLSRDADSAELRDRPLRPSDPGSFGASETRDVL